MLVGGGAKLPKIVEEAKKDLKLTVKLGTPRGVISLNSDPSFLPVIGLLVGVAELEGRGGKRRMNFDFLQQIKRVIKPFIP